MLLLRGIPSLLNPLKHMLRSIYPKMKIFIAPFLLVLGCLLFMFAVPASDYGTNKKAVAVSAAPATDSSMRAMNVYSRFGTLYSSLKLDSLQLSMEAFNYGLQGYQELMGKGEIKNDHIISIVDFSLPSTKKRLLDRKSTRLNSSHLVI